MVTRQDNARQRRYRNGSPWRDPDVLHVLLVTMLTTALSLGAVYLWALLRTFRCARSAGNRPARAGTVIVFGKRLQAGRPDAEYRWRLRRSLGLLRADPNLVVLISGGRSGAVHEPTEAEAGRDWLLRRMPEAASRLRIEAASADTIDNLRQARALLPPGPVALLSNRYHLARCRLLARHMGLESELCAAEPALRVDARSLGRISLEAGYLTLFVVGRSWARLIGHRRMLARVS